MKEIKIGDLIKITSLYIYYTDSNGGKYNVIDEKCKVVNILEDEQKVKFYKCEFLEISDYVNLYDGEFELVSKKDKEIVDNNLYSEIN